MRLLALLLIASFAGFGADTADKNAQELAKKEEKARKEAEKQAEKEAKKAADLAKKADKEAGKKAVKQKNDPNEIGNRDVGKGLNFYSIEKEIALGKGLAQEVEKSAKVVDDPIIAEYVNRVGQNIVRNSDSHVPFVIKVIEDDSINAFALPGGFFFVNSGLLLAAKTEAELAGVMAHEIAHVAARHGTRQDSRQQFAQYMTIPLIFMGGGWASYGIRQAASVLIPIGFLKFSRAFEKEADNLGLQYMYKTGYDPVAFVDFFETIQAQDKTKKGAISQYFSSHPPTDDRITDTQKNIQANLEARPEYLVTTSEFNKVKARLAMLENRRKGEAPASDGPTLKRKPGSTDEDDIDAEEAKEDRPKLEKR
jgi:beta-barrel assembly-enhancing protease